MSVIVGLSLASLIAILIITAWYGSERLRNRVSEETSQYIPDEAHDAYSAVADRLGKPPADAEIFLLGAIGFVVYIYFVLRANIALFQNSPVNLIENTSLKDANASFLAKKEKRYGLTYGEDPQMSFHLFSFDHLEVALTAVVLALAILLVWYVVHTKISSLPALLFLFGWTYLSLYLVSLSHILPMNFYIEACTLIPAESLYKYAIPLFWVNILIQSVSTAIVPMFWSIDVIPDFVRDSSGDIRSDSLKSHLENWRQYGTWTVSIFGGLALTVAVTVVTNASPYGSAFVRYFLVLLGGMLLLIMGYVIYKTHKVERELVGLEQ